MRKTYYLLAALLITAGLLTACGGGGTASGQNGAATPATSGGATSPTSAAPAGDAGAGQALFAQATIGSSPGCQTCHSVDGSKLVGPTMQGIGSRAGQEVEGQSAEEYLHASIVDPNVHVVEGYAEGVMPSFKTVLSDQQVNDLVAYLLTLK